MLKQSEASVCDLVKKIMSSITTAEVGPEEERS